MMRIIVGIVVLILSIVSFVISIRSFMQKGFLLNNAFIYATKEEREKMDKKPYYRQTAIVFMLIGIIFLINGLQLLLKKSQLMYAVLFVTILTVVYAIVSTVKIERK